MQHIYQSIDGWFDFEDIYWSMVQKAQSQAHFVEVGAFKGKSASYMAVEIAKSNKSIRFDVIDTWEGSAEHQHGGTHQDADVMAQGLYETFLANIESVRAFINPIRMTSLEAATLYKDGSLDFVFIDASHDYENVKADILAWRPKVKPGGFLGGHDYNELFPGVAKAVHELVSDFERTKFSWLTQVKA